MPYIGRGPAKSGAFRILDDVSGSFNGSTTSFALTVGSAALTVGLPETLLIAVDGVVQEAGSAYTISGSNIVFTAAPQADATFWGVELGDVGGIAEQAITQSASNDSTKIATTAYVDNQIDVQLTAEDLDVTGDSGTIAIDLDSEALAITGGTGITTAATGNAVNIVGHAEAHTVVSHSDTTATGAELDTLTDGSTTALHVHAARKLDDLATPDDNTDLDSSTSEHGLLRKLDNSTTNFLRGDGTWAAAGGGAMTLIGSTNVTSNVSYVDFTGFSGYETYFLQVSNAVPSSDGPYAVMYIGQSSGFELSDNDYGWHNFQIRANSATPTHTNFPASHNGDNESSYILLFRRGVGSDTNEGFSCSMWIHNKGTQRTRVHGTYCGTTYLNETYGGLVIGEAVTALTMDRVRFRFTTGSIASGRVSVYGVSHA